MGQTAAPSITENVEENEEQTFDTTTREGLEAYARQGIVELQQAEQDLADQGITSMNVQLNDMKRMLGALTDIEGKTVQIDPESGGIRITDVETGDYNDSVVSMSREITDENGNVTVETDTPVIDESNLVTVVENGQPQIENLENIDGLPTSENGVGQDQAPDQIIEDAIQAGRQNQESQDLVTRLTQDEQMQQAMDSGPFGMIIALFMALANGENPMEAMKGFFNKDEEPAQEEELAQAIPEDAQERAERFEENGNKIDENAAKIAENNASGNTEANAELEAENQALLEENLAIVEYEENLAQIVELEQSLENMDAETNEIAPENDGEDSSLTGVNNSASTYTYDSGTSGVGSPVVNLDEGTVEISGQSGSDAFNSVSNPDEGTISQVDARVDQTVDANAELEGQENTTDAQVVVGMGLN